jgi:hypothetical protein
MEAFIFLTIIWYIGYQFTNLMVERLSTLTRYPKYKLSPAILYWPSILGYVIGDVIAVYMADKSCPLTDDKNSPASTEE